MTGPDEAKNSSKSTVEPLGKMLLDEQLITPEKLNHALELKKKHGGTLAGILVQHRLVKAEDVAMIQSVILNVPLIDLKEHSPTEAALRLVPEDVARKHTLLPLDVVAGALVVVMADPTDIRAIEDVRAISGMRLEPSLAVAQDIQRAIETNYRATQAIEKRVSEFARPVEEKPSLTSESIARSPIAQSVELLVAQAVKDRASDVHLVPQPDRVRVRYRIDGILHDMFSLPAATLSPLVSRIKVLGGMNIAETRRPQDGQFSLVAGNREVDIRVATMETAYGERVTMRILDKELSLVDLPDLGFQAGVLKKYRSLLVSPFGLILVGGPTGSGKTTTLYASVNQLNQDELNILTIEDPIEYRFPRINQTQVNFKAGITFAGGLRALMRHDPDVILVGEIRDHDTAETAVQAALTGHLVLSSIHANDAIGIFYRLRDLNIELYLIASTLIASLAQRMVRKICPHCRTAYQPTREELKLYDEEVSERPPQFFTGTGCTQCADTGFLGRTGIFELLPMSETLRKCVLDNAASDEMRAHAVKEGFVSMRRDGMLKVKSGVTTIGEVVRTVFGLS